jgi:hypothetical protein
MELKIKFIEKVLQEYNKSLKIKKAGKLLSWYMKKKNIGAINLVRRIYIRRDLYNTISTETLLHEGMHSVQGKRYGMFKYFFKYIFSKKFRFKLEREAYMVSFFVKCMKEVIKGHTPRKVWVNLFLTNFKRICLSKNPYRYMCPEAETHEWWSDNYSRFSQIYNMAIGKVPIDNKYFQLIKDTLEIINEEF